jgi:Ca2+-binding RTX toxin-like protein
MRPAAVTLLVAGLLVAPSTSNAAVRSTYTAPPMAMQGTLRVESDADDAIVVACIGGRVEVNGSPPDTGPLECSRPVTIEAVGGPGANRIDLSGIAPAQSSGTFRGVAAYATLDGGAGDDTIVGPSAGLVKLTGGAGSDWIQGQRFAYDTYLFGPAEAPERDTVVETITSECDPSYVDTNQPGLSYWTVPWDAADFRSLSADDPVTYDERAPAGLLASHRNRTIVAARPGFGIGIEAVAGSAADDRLMVGCMGVGGAGDDSLEATGSDGDWLLGGPGDDELIGGYGPDNLDGGAGADTLGGGAGGDAIFGGAGNDALRGGPDGDTYLFASADGAQSDFAEETRGAGVDVLSFDLAASVPVTVDLSTRSAVLARARDLELRTLARGGAFFEGVIGGRGNDRLTGHAGRNYFWSGGGTDLAIGGAGSDRYYVDWTASMPYWAYNWGEVWTGPLGYSGSLSGRPDSLARETPRSILRIVERPKGGVDTIDFADRWLAYRHGGARLEGQVNSGLRINLTAPLWIARTKRVGAVNARRHGGRHLEGVRGTVNDDVLIGNAASNVLEGRHGRDRVVGGKGKDLCLIESRGERDRLTSCERIRRVDPDR